VQSISFCPCCIHEKEEKETSYHYHPPTAGLLPGSGGQEVRNCMSVMLPHDSHHCSCRIPRLVIVPVSPRSTSFNCQDLSNIVHQSSMDSSKSQLMSPLCPFWPVLPATLSLALDPCCCSCKMASRPVSCGMFISCGTNKCAL